MLLAMQILAGLVIFATFWALLPRDEWWVRGFDFPRIQFIVIAVVVLALLVIFDDEIVIIDICLLIMLAIALIFQLRMVLPYTFLWKKEVKNAENLDETHQIKLLVSNVLTPNDNKQALLNHVKTYQPDILLTLETDQAWENALAVIEDDYPYQVKIPLDNLYGMHLYSRLELIDPEVKFLIVDDIPSIHTQLRLKNGEVVRLYCLHPMPPSPTEADKSTTRDAELLMVGEEINHNDYPAILAGDLNDVAWSRTTRMFQRVSGLLDPRIGRYFINTFHVKYPFFRWALDHVFHSNVFTFVNMARLPSIGSDHFPVLTVLQYEPQARHKQAEPTPTAEDHAESYKAIEEGKKEGEKLSDEREEDKAEQKVTINV